MNMISMVNGFTLFGLDIKFYGIIIACAMLIGVFVARYNCRFRNLNKDDILILACYVLPLAILGARTYFVIFADHAYTFIEFWQIWNGGLAIYGGVIGGAIGVLLFCLIHKKNFLDFADVVVPALILGQAIGRWGNFFNQEAYGTPVTNPALQWFPFSVFIENCRQPDCCGGAAHWHLATFFYESILNLIIFIILMILIRKVKGRGIITSAYFILYGAVRTFVEGLRTDSLFLWGTGLRVSQALSILLMIFGIIYIGVYYYLQYRKKKKISVEKQSP